MIEQAKGMLMLVYGIGEQQAFELLRSCSQHTNVRLRELPQRVLTELPTRGGQATKAPLRVGLNRILSGRSPQHRPVERTGDAARRSPSPASIDHRPHHRVEIDQFTNSGRFAQFATSLN
ncbi:ANTAR domain-containing protein [Nocardia sp. NPDC057455]|uniref:ANTAR domain-containing protein n=1 Tax=Nocardia sp. NPDC057455 TaxID=3346138 RepID=UPI00366C4D83